MKICNNNVNTEESSLRTGGSEFLGRDPFRCLANPIHENPVLERNQERMEKGNWFYTTTGSESSHAMDSKNIYVREQEFLPRRNLWNGQDFFLLIRM